MAKTVQIKIPDKQNAIFAGKLIGAFATVSVAYPAIYILATKSLAIITGQNGLNDVAANLDFPTAFYAACGNLAAAYLYADADSKAKKALAAAAFCGAGLAIGSTYFNYEAKYITPFKTHSTPLVNESDEPHTINLSCPIKGHVLTQTGSNTFTCRKLTR